MVYWPDMMNKPNLSKIKVFKQFKVGFFDEYTDHSLNGMEIQPNSQPFFLDINGDFM